MCSCELLLAENETRASQLQYKNIKARWEHLRRSNHQYTESSLPQSIWWSTYVPTQQQWSKRQYLLILKSTKCTPSLNWPVVKTGLPSCSGRSPLWRPRSLMVSIKSRGACRKLHKWTSHCFTIDTLSLYMNMSYATFTDTKAQHLQLEATSQHHNHTYLKLFGIGFRASYSGWPAGHLASSAALERLKKCPCSNVKEIERKAMKWSVFQCLCSGFHLVSTQFSEL